MVLNRASYMSAADWVYQTQVKNYHNFSCVVIWFFSGVEIPIKHSSYIINTIIIANCLLRICSSSSRSRGSSNVSRGSTVVVVVVVVAAAAADVAAVAH